MTFTFRFVFWPAFWFASLILLRLWPGHVNVHWHRWRVFSRARIRGWAGHALFLMCESHAFEEWSGGRVCETIVRNHSAKPYQISLFTVITVQWATTVNCVFVEGQPGLQTSLLCYRGDLEQWGDCLLPQRCGEWLRKVIVKQYHMMVLIYLFIVFKRCAWPFNYLMT